MAEGVVFGGVSAHPEWRVIVNHLHAADYGTEISHDEMSRLIGLPLGRRAYYNAVGRARIELRREWQRELETVRTVGYRLVKPSEFNRCARREIRLAGHRIRNGRDVLVAAPQHLLNDEENRRNADALAKIGRIESLRRAALRDTRPSMSPSPRPDVPKITETH